MSLISDIIDAVFVHTTAVIPDVVNHNAVKNNFQAEPQENAPWCQGFGVAAVFDQADEGMLEQAYLPQFQIMIDSEQGDTMWGYIESLITAIGADYTLGGIVYRAFISDVIVDDPEDKNVTLAIFTVTALVTK